MVEKLFKSMMHLQFLFAIICCYIIQMWWNIISCASAKQLTSLTSLLIRPTLSTAMMNIYHCRCDYWNPISIHSLHTDRHSIQPRCIYRQISNINRPLVGNKLVDHSDVVGASPVSVSWLSPFYSKRLMCWYIHTSLYVCVQPDRGGWELIDSHGAGTVVCPFITGRGIGTETCEMDNVFPPDDL